MDAVVGMGDAVASSNAGDTLACVGLGSCIGLALYDRRRGVAALAHVMLPKAPAPTPPNPGKYADLAVPALVTLAMEKGAAVSRLEAVVVGGATMFPADGAPELGARNAAAVLASLAEFQIPVRLQDVGGSRGRTFTIAVSEEMATSVREAA